MVFGAFFVERVMKVNKQTNKCRNYHIFSQQSLYVLNFVGRYIPEECGYPDVARTTPSQDQWVFACSGLL